MSCYSLEKLNIFRGSWKIMMGSLDKITISGCDFLADESGQQVLHVRSPHALMQAVGYLKHTAEPWERIFLRGQSRLYGTLSPTLYRGMSGPATKGRLHERQARIIQEFASACSIVSDLADYAREPLLQHYGIKTTWLDIVDNVWVALWFALHHARVSGPESQYMHFDARSSPVDGEFGYILLIRTDDNRVERVKKGTSKGTKTEAIDLRIAAPSVFLRPHAQHGLLFRSRGTEGGRVTDYSDAIAGIIRFSLEAGKAWLGVGGMHDVRALFPPPYFDNGYQILLGVSLTDKSLGVITHVGA